MSLIRVGAAALLGAAAMAFSAGAEDFNPKPFPPPPPLEINKPADERIVVPEKLKISPDDEAICAAAQARGEPLPLGCSERRLQDLAARTPPVPNAPPFSSNSPDHQIGLFNETAVRQQFGKNYGVDGRPFRPVRSYTAPIRTAPPVPAPDPGGVAPLPPPPRSILNR